MYLNMSSIDWKQKNIYNRNFEKFGRKGLPLLEFLQYLQGCQPWHKDGYWYPPNQRNSYKTPKSCPSNSIDPLGTPKSCPSNSIDPIRTF